MSIITDIWAREILDSRGNPTVEVEVVLESGVFVAQQSLQVLQQAQKKPLNFGTKTKKGIKVKG